MFDPQRTPHASTDQLSGWLGVKKPAMANPIRLIRNTLVLSHVDSEIVRRHLIEADPLAWLLEVDGMLVEAGPAHAFNCGPMIARPEFRS